MANAKQSRRLRRTARNSWPVVVLLFLPLLALGGALMPGMVDVEEEETTHARERADAYFQPLRVKRRPLLIPRDFTNGFIPDLASFDRIFGTSVGGDLLRQQVADVNLGVSDGDLIILDDIEEFVSNVLFKDALETPGLEEDPDYWDEQLFALIPNPIGYESPHQFDDFGGSADQVAPIPEPGTGLLMALGLVVLAWSGQRREKAPVG